ncbi:MAG: ABC transporter substrate-binding protein [Rickettsiaceae bacterium]
MKRLVLKLFLLFLPSCISSSFADDKITITVNQFVSHIALDAAYEGLTKGLEDRGIVPQKANLILSNAQGNIGNSVQISKHQASLKPDFMVAIATPAAQTNLKAKTTGSILAFLAVTDPDSTGLVGRDDIIGVTDSPPIAGLISKALEIFPATKNIGVIFNSGEVNSLKIIETLTEILQARNIQLKKIAITNSNEIKNAFNKLAGTVDLLYLPQDNSVVSALGNIVSLSKDAKLPLIANDPTLVDKGVFLALGSNYFKSGQQLANMIADLIEHKSLEQKIQSVNENELKINYKLADELGIIIPKNLQVEVEK